MPTDPEFRQRRQLSADIEAVNQRLAAITGQLVEIAGECASLTARRDEVGLAAVVIEPGIKRGLVAAAAAFAGQQPAQAKRAKAS